ncbi:MAG: PAS domain S-box protein, partial [Mariprofundaceae bacterium]
TYISIKFPLSDENGNQYGVGGISTDITDRANSEHLLQEVRDRHEEAQRVAHLGHWELDLIKDELTWSTETYHIYGIDVGEKVTYESFLEIVHPDDQDGLKQEFSSSVENRTPYDIEHRLLMQDGTIKWVQERCKTFYDEDGTPLRSIGTTQDVTEQKLASLERKESEARLSSILEMAVDAIISIDEEQNIVLFNKAAEKMFGYAQLDVLGEHVSKLIPERYRQGHQGKVDAFLTNDSTDSINRNRGMFGLRRTGEEFQMETTISKQTLSDNKTLMTVMIRDIQDQLSAEEAQRKLSRAVQEAGEAILITNRDAVIEYVNPAFTKITGYEPEELIGQTPAILKSTAQDPAFYKELWDTITRGEVWHGTLIDKKKDGSFYPAMMSVAPIHDDQGEITHYVSLQQDVTEYKRLEQQFLQAQKMESIGTLVGGIAHDFNNILAAMMGNIHLARVKKSDAEVVETKLENIEKLSNRAADMIRQLLTFSRNDMVQLKAIPLTPFVKEGFKLAKSAVAENIECVLDVCSEDMTVVADATQLQQVIMNLLNNARDAVADVKTPQISCSLKSFAVSDGFVEKHPDFKDENLAEIVIRDNGSGIKEEHLNKVFEPFFTTKGVGEGTGLGLSMVYGAVQNYGGVVEVESEVGKGTAFHIYLPVKEEMQGPVSQSDAALSHGDGEMLLLVDDEDDIRGTTQELLNSLGYETLVAADGEKALEIYRANREKVRLVITDIVMPKMGGIDLMKAIHQLDKKIPIVFMTGYDMGHLLESENLESNQVISKPFSVEKLSELIYMKLKGDKTSKS